METTEEEETGHEDDDFDDEPRTDEVCTTFPPESEAIETEAQPTGTTEGPSPGYAEDMPSQLPSVAASGDWRNYALTLLTGLVLGGTALGTVQATTPGPAPPIPAPVTESIARTEARLERIEERLDEAAREAQRIVRNMGRVCDRTEAPCERP